MNAKLNILIHVSIYDTQLLLFPRYDFTFILTDEVPDIYIMSTMYHDAYY